MIAGDQLYTSGFAGNLEFGHRLQIAAETISGPADHVVNPGRLGQTLPQGRQPWSVTTTNAGVFIFANYLGVKPPGNASTDAALMFELRRDPVLVERGTAPVNGRPATTCRRSPFLVQ